jgi:hypothetical protein
VRDRPHLGERVRFVVLGLNVLGVIVYLLWASQTWIAPQEKGMNTASSGDALVWGVVVLPLFAVFFILNLIWGSLILFHRLWRTGRLWLAVLAIWAVAIVIDIVRHH